jgi:hypothetical protein
MERKRLYTVCPPFLSVIMYAYVCLRSNSNLKEIEIKLNLKKDMYLILFILLGLN